MNMKAMNKKYIFFLYDFKIFVVFIQILHLAVHYTMLAAIGNKVYIFSPFCIIQRADYTSSFRQKTDKLYTG